ncbi:Thioesterase superfamily protein [Blastococcus sp. DSM 46786]|uniref:PaaI family thioesterase n=1 Tax=Blastococcus sp. DSM 46786 TaxID=1798227 RepID=UPI0008ACF984|nr:PaaI family thioesterase [Blastococcus sp. DSM 46786]SEL32294.1 Thioesterase superfamily protein [Blastococcus sp. DSM 46786]
MTTNDGAPDPGAPADADLMTASIDLAAALRELIELSATTTADATAVRSAAELVRAATGQLEGPRRPLSQLPRLDDPAARRRTFNPVSGVANGMAPPLRFRVTDGVVSAEATLGAAYEGPPTFLHGGMSALFMDQVLGDTAAVNGLWGMTAHLELDYRGPVPLGRPLAFRGWVEETSGRKSVIAGSIALADAPDRPLVEARGIFVMPRPEKLESYFGSVTDVSGAHRPPGNPGDATVVEQV